MLYTDNFISPIGTITLACDDIGLAGLWLEGQKYFAKLLEKAEFQERAHPVLEQTKSWLAIYFQGEEPGFRPPLHLVGSAFQVEVWKLLLAIPYGKTTSYGELAQVLAKQRGVPQFSARAIGNAVGHNPISIIIPCHRVVGANGSLTGYAGGLDKKKFLLQREDWEINKLRLPKR